MKLKKILAAVAAAAVTVLMLSACADPEKTAVTVGLPDGAPALAFAEIIAEQPVISENLDLKCEVVTSDGSTEAPSIVGAKLVSGDYQMAVLPTNVAANLYNKGTKIKAVTVNTWGNLYMVSKSAPLSSLNDLKGEIVYNISQSGVPNVVFTNLLNRANIEWTDTADEAVEGKVVIKYMAATAMIPALKQGKVKYGILGEPAATRANANAGTSTVLDLQSAWADAYGGDGGYPQAALVARADFLEKNGELVAAIAEKLASNAAYLANQDNLDKAVAKVAELAPATSLASLKVATVERCAVRAVKAADCKDAVKTFLSAFGIAVDDAFFAAL